MNDHRLFPNGEAFETWDSRNCARCKKQYVEASTVAGCHWQCAIQEAIDVASTLDGCLPKDWRESIGKRLKWDGKDYLEHDCPELEPL